MKKIYVSLCILNNIAASIIAIKYFSEIDASAINSLLMIGLLIFYFGVSIAIIRNKIKISILDMIMISVYMIFVIGIFLLSILLQNNNQYVFTMFYHVKLLLIPNIIFNIYNALE